MRCANLFLPMLMSASLVNAEPLKVENAVVLLGSPAAMVNAGYMTLHNVSEVEVELIGASAQGFAMTHFHASEEIDGVATMSSVDAIRIEPDQYVFFRPGGMHIMLMRPEAALEKDAIVPITLLYADGTRQEVEFIVVARESLKSKLNDHGS